MPDAGDDWLVRQVIHEEAQRLGISWCPEAFEKPAACFLSLSDQRYALSVAIELSLAVKRRVRLTSEINELIRRVVWAHLRRPAEPDPADALRRPTPEVRRDQKDDRPHGDEPLVIRRRGVRRGP